MAWLRHKAGVLNSCKRTCKPLSARRLSPRWSYCDCVNGVWPSVLKALICLSCQKRLVEQSQKPAWPSMTELCLKYRYLSSSKFKLTLNGSLRGIWEHSGSRGDMPDVDNASRKCMTSIVPANSRSPWPNQVMLQLGKASCRSSNCLSPRRSCHEHLDSQA